MAESEHAAMRTNLLLVYIRHDSLVVVLLTYEE
jgi:hypothetical protein